MEAIESLDPQYEWLNKQQVGEILGKSDKGVQRLTASGQLLAVYVKEGSYQRAYYRANDVKYFHQHGHAPIPTGVTEDSSTTNAQDTVVTKDKKALVQSKLSPDKIISGLITQVLNEAQKRGLLNLASSSANNVKHKPIVSVADKMILTIAEAAALSGHPEGELRKAHAAGKLHAVKLGKGLKIRKEDLKLYIDSLFAKV